jgi:hypothetical protein
MDLRKWYDGVNAEMVPAGADGYMGYIDGLYRSFEDLKLKFPLAKHLAIAVNPADNAADVLDVEKGDATPSDAPGWVVRRRRSGHKFPTVYCAEGNWEAVKAAFAEAHVPEPFYIIAAYPGDGATVPEGAVGHQFVDHGGYDESVFLASYPPLENGHPAPWPPVDHGSTPAPARAVPIDVNVVLKPKSTGPDIALLIKALGTKGIHVLPTRTYDEALFKAVFKFQTKAGIHRDGLCGPQTWHALGY